MNVPNVGGYSFGEWVAVCRAWSKAHGKNEAAPPTEDEFDRAVMNVRGL